MHAISWLVGAALVGVASASSAQPNPQTHEQHEATDQHQTVDQHLVANRGEKCCCEQMMGDMHRMMEMMQRHHGMGMMPGDAPKPDKNPAQ